MLSPHELTPAERELWDAFPAGRLVDLRTGVAEDDDPGAGERWGVERAVRAEVLVALLLGANERTEHAVAALRLAGARITGRLFLDEAEVAHSLWLEGCWFDEEVSMTGAATRTLSFQNCRMRRFDARLIRVGGRFILEHSVVNGQLSLIDARVAGSLHLSSSTLSLPGDWALFAGGLELGGALFARRGFTVHGGTRLVGAQLPGLLLEGASLGEGFGHSLYADKAEIMTLVCTDGFTAEATISLRGAHITDLLTFDTARLNGKDLALDCARARIGDLQFTPATRPPGAVDLRDAQVGVVRDRHGAWPEAFHLQGLTYDTLQFDAGAGVPDDVTLRVGWLRKASGYAPQPYEQLAGWYRKIGNDTDARRVLLEKHRHRRRTLPLAGRVWGHILDVTVGYGYRPWRAGAWLLALTLLGSLVFQYQDRTPRNPGQTSPFHPVAYTLDLLIPIGGLGQRNSWYWESTPAQWLAYALIAAGWLLTTAVVAGVTRQLNRT
ncbi:oxidoreductase [Streptomyces sp. NBC_01304]|uniref:oxidoreductase n=1 Tax=Streptomyces sp. NBC_01304 TaxID=2903818 RepID=UPI002E14887B|nr:oxidoreductase [Streptomyces sp. NBC_01304]